MLPKIYSILDESDQFYNLGRIENYVQWTLKAYQILHSR